MNETKTIEDLLIEAAERRDKKLDAARVRRLRESYAVFTHLGLSDDDIKAVLVITDYEMQQLLRC